MSILVGDVISNIRTEITDQPQTLPAPAASFATVTATSTLPVGNYYLKVTQRNPWGETSPSSESLVQAVGSGQGIQVTSQLVPGATSIRAYLTLANGPAGSECQYVESTVSPFTITAPPTGAAGPPSRNTAYNPDTDGDSFSAATIYRWLNDALKLASQICGGLIDYGGVGSTVGNPMYVIPGQQWRAITDLWYDGYPLAPDKAGNFFRRNAITASVLSQVTTSLLTDRMMLEIWPQPARTSASTTLAAPISATATSLTAASLGGFLLTNGMVQVDDELMFYNPLTGNTLSNLIRGLGGSVAAAHAAAAPIRELNIFWHGWRVFNPAYSPGQSMLTVPVPIGWETLIDLYGLARVRLSEQNTDEYLKLLKQYQDGLAAWLKTNKVTTGPKQIGESSGQLEVIPTLGGGWVVP